MEEPRWLVDEMLGRLARYLRFLGYDTEYVRGASDEAVARRARQEGRRLITRDRDLARRTADSVLLSRTDIGGQMRELGRAFPPLRHEVSFERCSLCNGRLVPLSGRPAGSFEEVLPPEVYSGRKVAYVCSQCHHPFWEGSHTRAVRARLEEWRRSEAPAP